jgi:hypothetical protein
LESKRAVLAQAVRESWTLVFEHDPTVAWGIPAADGKDLVLRDTVEAPGGVSLSSPAAKP